MTKKSSDSTGDVYKLGRPSAATRTRRNQGHLAIVVRQLAAFSSAKFANAFDTYRATYLIPRLAWDPGFLVPSMPDQTDRVDKQFEALSPS